MHSFFFHRLLLPLLIFAVVTARGFGAAPPEVLVIFWFDTEDYLLPADDDASKELAELLTARGIRATFKLVGEKARVLEKRGRTDVIQALQKHDIGYHSDFHSVHPTPSEYLGQCGLLDGMAEFVRREKGGAADIRRIFAVNTLSCYGQPGSSWAPQTIAALPQIGVLPNGVPCYVDEGDHVGLKGKPFWYENALVVYNMGPNTTRMDLHDDKAVQPGKDKVTAIADRLRREGGGLISIYYHPCEWVHQEFWDGVNFRRGANPPREEWKAPPQRPMEQTKAAFARYAGYVDHIKSLPGVRFVTATDLTRLYTDSAKISGASSADLVALAEAILASNQVDYRTIGAATFSPADQFELLTQAVAALLRGDPILFPLKTAGLLGPDAAPPANTHPSALRWTAFRDATLDVASFIRTQGRIPARVFVGPDPMPPADFLAGLAKVFSIYSQTGKLPQNAEIRLGENTLLAPVRHVASDTPNLFGGWIIHKEGYRAPQILEVARQQAWTLKPALRAQ